MALTAQVCKEQLRYSARVLEAPILFQFQIARRSYKDIARDAGTGSSQQTSFWPSLNLILKLPNRAVSTQPKAL